MSHIKAPSAVVFSMATTLCSVPTCGRARTRISSADTGNPVTPKLAKRPVGADMHHAVQRQHVQR